MAIEPIEPLPSVIPGGDVVASESPLVDYLRQTHAPAAVIALAEAQVQATETVEQRAAAGDPAALHHLAVEESLHKLVTKSDANVPPVEHHVGDHGVHEPGKGDVIDIYD